MLDEGRRIVTGISRAEHIFHFVVTVFTGGLWGIVWIKRAIGQKRVSRFK